jgi:hypothetical protein
MDIYSAPVWKKFDSEAEVQGWKRQKPGGGFEYRYQEEDPNQAKDGKEETPDSADAIKQHPLYRIGEDWDNDNAVVTVQNPLIGRVTVTLPGSGSYNLTTFDGKGGALRVKNEVLANMLYSRCNIRNSDIRGITKYKGKPAVMSLPERGQDQEFLKKLSYEDREELTSGFVMDCFLSNKEVMGLKGGGSIVRPYGIAYRDSHHGALLFNKDGSIKKDFSSEVSEIETMRDAGKNPSAAAVFGDMSDKAILRQIVALAKSVNPAYLKEVVYKVFDKEPDVADEVYGKLVARRKWLMKWAKDKALEMQEGGKGEPRKLVPFTQVNEDMTQEELNEIQAYTGSGYHRLNSYLRDGETFGEDVDVTEQKIDRLVGSLSKLPPYRDVVVRNSSIGEETLAILMNMEAGDVINMKAFTSTTRRDFLSIFAGGADVQFKITSKSGRSVEKLSSHKSEQEVLFGPGVRFKLSKDVYFDPSGNNRFIVELEEISPEELKDKKPVNAVPRKTSPEDVRKFLLMNPKLTLKQRQRIQRLDGDDLMKIAFAIFAKGKKGQEKEVEEAEAQGLGGFKKFTEIFI